MAPLLALLLGVAGCRSPISVTDADAPLAFQSNVFVGQRQVDDHPVFEDHLVWGVEAIMRPEPGWLAFELGATLADEDQTVGSREHEADFYEGYAGVRAVWDRALGPLTPYAGVGGSYLKVNRESNGPGGPSAEEDWSGGGYARLGTYAEVGRLGVDGGVSVLLGVDVRAVVGQDYDLLQGVVFLGFGRPGPEGP